MGNVFIDAVCATKSRLAEELRLAAGTAAGRQFRGTLLASADELCSQGTAPRDVTLVLGEELGDGAQASWAVCGYERAQEAGILVKRLNELARAYGRSIGNAELVALDHRQRRELEAHLRHLDRHVKVGRHGVRWYQQNSVVIPM